MEIKLNPIAYVQNSIHNVTDDHWGSVISVIELINGTETAWQGIEEFTHVELSFISMVYQMKKLDIKRGIRETTKHSRRSEYLHKEAKTDRIN